MVMHFRSILMLAGAVLVFMDRTPLQAIAEEVRRGDRVAMAEALGARLAH